MTGRRTLLVLAATAFAVVAVLVAWRSVDAWHAVGRAEVERPGEPLSRPGMVDFRDASYYPGVALREGDDPYDVEEYLAREPVGQHLPPYAPSHVLLHLPLTWLSLRAAEAVYLVLSMALVVVLAVVVLRAVGLSTSALAVLGLTTALLAATPVRYTLIVGQPTMIVVLGCTLALTARSRAVGAVGLALALTKPTFGIPLVLLVLALGRWRTAAAGVAVAVVASLPVGVALLAAEGGPSGLVEVLADNADYSAGSSGMAIGAPANDRVDVAALLGRLTGTTPGDAVELLVAVVIVGAAAAVVRRARAPGSGLPPAAVVSVVVLAVLLATYHKPYDLVLLALPVVALVVEARRPGADRRLAAAAALLVAAALNPLALRPIERHVPDDGVVSALVRSTTGAALLLAFVLLCAAIVTRAPSPASAAAPAVTARVAS